MDNQRKATWPGWETVRLIGRGSFGAVYEIQRQVFDDTEKAALKVITIPQNSGDIDEMYNDGYSEEDITETFQSHLKSIVAEYSLMRKLNGNTNIVHCEDVRYVQHEDGIGWDIFIKMELLTPLPKALSDTISEEMVIKLAKDMCSALEACCEHNIVHRDIKPQNIFVSKTGDYKLGDFGIAKTVEKTMGGTKIGTYKYMAPEVFHYQPYGTSADVYSLGLVLYWMLNERRLPFMPLPPTKLTSKIEEEAQERRITGEELPTPRNGSESLKKIVLKACAFDPKERYASAKEMLEALNGLGSEESVQVALDSVVEHESLESTTVEINRKKPNRFILPVLCATVIMIAAGLCAKSCTAEEKAESPHQIIHQETESVQSGNGYSLEVESDVIKVGESTNVALRWGSYIYRSDKALVWSSSDPAVAAVTQDGVITGMSVGTAVITGTMEGNDATITIMVEEKPFETQPLATEQNIPQVSQIQVGCRTDILLAGDTVDAYVKTDGFYLNGNSDGIEWSTDQPEVATVDSRGQVTGLKAGKCQLTAKYQGLSSTMEITIVEVDKTSGVAAKLDYEKLSLRTGNSDTVNLTVSGDLPEHCGLTAYYSAGMQLSLEWGEDEKSVPLTIHVGFAEVSEGYVTILAYDQDEPSNVVAAAKVQLKIN